MGFKRQCIKNISAPHDCILYTEHISYAITLPHGLESAKKAR